MSTDYSKMSDFEINLRVAEIVVDYDCISRLPYVDMAVHWGDGANWHVFNPCNNPADAWPIIQDYRIGVIPAPCAEEWKAAHRAIGDDDTPHYFSQHTNPLRAAMLVFLKMQESKNAS